MTQAAAPEAPAFALEGYQVLGIQPGPEGLVVRLQALPAPQACAACGQPRLRGHGRHVRHVADVPIDGNPVLLAIELRRLRCAACGRTCLQPLPHVDARRAMTLRLVRWIVQACGQPRRLSCAGVAGQLGLNEKTIRNVLRDQRASPPAKRARQGAPAPAPVPRTR